MQARSTAVQRSVDCSFAGHAVSSSSLQHASDMLSIRWSVRHVFHPSSTMIESTSKTMDSSPQWLKMQILRIFPIGCSCAGVTHSRCACGKGRIHTALASCRQLCCARIVGAAVHKLQSHIQNQRHRRGVMSLTCPVWLFV